MALHLEDENEKGGGPPDAPTPKYIPWLTPFALIIIAPICWFVFPMFVNKFNSELSESLKIFISGISFVAVIFVLYLFKEPLEKSLEVELKPFNASSIFAIVFFFILAGSIQYSSELSLQPQTQQTTTSTTFRQLPFKTLDIGQHQFELHGGETTPRLFIPNDRYYDWHCEGKAEYTIYFEDGTVVEAHDNSNIRLPEKTNTKFKIVSDVEPDEVQKFTINVMKKK